MKSEDINCVFAKDLWDIWEKCTHKVTWNSTRIGPEWRLTQILCGTYENEGSLLVEIE